MSFSKFSLLFIFFLLFGCSSFEPQRKYLTVRFEIISEIPINFTPVKCLYSFSAKTVFAWQQDTDEIHIYRDGKKNNTIGGIGFEQLNFTRLSDIALAPDGSLLTLDSFEKIIKKFDSQGKFIAAIDLADFSAPALFSVASDETFFIYDSDRNEIRNFARTNEYDAFSFGRFQLSAPSNLQLAGNRLLVNESSLSKTLIFNTFGQLEEELPGIFQIERNCKFQLFPNYLTAMNGNFAVSPDKWQSFLQMDGYTVLASRTKIVVGKFIYEVR